MPLVRIRDRRTITLTNFTFADGEVNLVHPCDVPFQTYNRLLYTDEGLEEYFEFSFIAGVTDEQDFLFLLDISTSEAHELGAKLREYTGHANHAQSGGDVSPLRLSDKEEAILDEFARSLGLNPQEDDDEGEEGDVEPDSF